MKSINTKGFAAVETVLIIAIVALVAVSGYLIYNTKKTASDTLDKANKASQAPVERQQSLQITKKSSTLSTYTSKYTGATFDFPASWKTRFAQNAQVKKDTLTVTSPSGKISIGWNSEILGVGSDCTVDVAPSKIDASGSIGCPTWTNTSILPLSYGHGLKVVEGYGLFGDKNYAVYAAVQAPDSELLTSNRGPMFSFYEFGSHRSDFGVAIKDNGKPAFHSSAAAVTFLQTNPEFKTAVQTLQSLSYH
jgi:hypothetical protein